MGLEFAGRGTAISVGSISIIADFVSHSVSIAADWIAAIAWKLIPSSAWIAIQRRGVAASHAVCDGRAVYKASNVGQESVACRTDRTVGSIRTGIAVWRTCLAYAEDFDSIGSISAEKVGLDFASRCTSITVDSIAIIATFISNSVSITADWIANICGWLIPNSAWVAS